MEYAQFYSIIIKGIENTLGEKDFSRLPLEPIEAIIKGTHSSLTKSRTSKIDTEAYAKAYIKPLVEVARGVLSVKSLQEKLGEVA